MSKTVENQLRYARFVMSSVHTHGDAVAQAIQARSTTNPDHQLTAADVNKVLTALTGQLAERLTAYESARSLVIREGSEDTSALRAFEEAVDAMRLKLSEAIGLLNSSFPPHVARDARLHTPLETQRDLLISRVAYAVNHFKQSPFEQQNSFGMTMSTRAIADTLEPLLQDAIRARDALLRDQRETQAARQARDTAEAEFVRTLTQSAAVIEAFMRMSDHTPLANRLRPTQRRVRGDINIADEPTQNDPSPPSDPTA